MILAKSLSKMHFTKYNFSFLDCKLPIVIPI